MEETDAFRFKVSPWLYLAPSRYPAIHLDIYWAPAAGPASSATLSRTYNAAKDNNNNLLAYRTKRIDNSLQLTEQQASLLSIIASAHLQTNINGAGELIGCLPVERHLSRQSISLPPSLSLMYSDLFALATTIYSNEIDLGFAPDCSFRNKKAPNNHARRRRRLVISGRRARAQITRLPN